MLLGWEIATSATLSHQKCTSGEFHKVLGNRCFYSGLFLFGNDHSEWSPQYNPFYFQMSVQHLFRWESQEKGGCLQWTAKPSSPDEYDKLVWILSIKKDILVLHWKKRNKGKNLKTPVNFHAWPSYMFWVMLIPPPHHGHSSPSQSHVGSSKTLGWKSFRVTIPGILFVMRNICFSLWCQGYIRSKSSLIFFYFWAFLNTGDLHLELQ